jgi:polysaccharide chain length determinant protein (PEP-CTERM system associated)
MMEEQFEDKQPMRGLGDYWEIVARRRWWIIGPLFCGFLLVFLSAWIIPAEYTSESLILVEHQKVPETYVPPNVQVDLQGRLVSMTQQVLSRPRLLTIIEQMKLYPSYASSPDEQVKQMRDDIKIEPVLAPAPAGKPADLVAFRVSYKAHRPEVAQQVNARLANFFIDENVRASQIQSEATTHFLEGELKNASDAMAAQIAKVQAFESAHNGELPSQVQSDLQILSGTQGQLQGAIVARDRAMQQQEYLNSMLAQYESIGAANGANAGPNLDTQLTNMKAGLAELRSKYTDDHPDIKKLKEQIAATEKLKQEVDETNREESKTDANSQQVTAMAPLLQIQSQLKANKMELQRNEQEIQRLQAKAAEYQNRLNAVPMVEQQLDEMQRNQEQAKRDYDALLAKASASNIATNLQKEQQGEQFRLIEPSTLPDKASFPDRFKFSLAGLGVGLVLAVLFGAGTEFTDDRIRSEIDLAEATTLPVIAEIPPLSTMAEINAARWRPYYALVAAVLVVILIPMGILYAYFWG